MKKKKWEELSAEEKKDVGYVPDAYVIDYVETENYEATLPSYFNLANNNGNSYWICNEYSMHGDKTCKSPKLYEKELDKIFKNVYSYLINNFDEIKDKLINIYKNTTFNACNEIEKLKKEINNLYYKKESLLELYIEKVIEKDEFETRNNKYNNEIQKLKKEIKELEKKNKNVAYNIFKSMENVNVDTVLATKKDGIKKFFLEDYDKE